jgi:fructokinase
LDLAAQTDCICFGTLIQRSRTSRHSLHELLEAATSSLKVLDVNLRTGCYSLDTVTSSLGWADVLRLNDHEVALLGQLLGVSTESVPRFADEMMRRWELSHCIVTLGERGVFAASAGGASVYVPGYGVEVVDLCGVGSAFTAGFIHKLLRGRPVDECCRLGNALGATVASQRGATAPIYADDLHRFMEADHDRVYEPSLRHLAAR